MPAASSAAGKGTPGGWQEGCGLHSSARAGKWSLVVNIHPSKLCLLDDRQERGSHLSSFCIVCCCRALKSMSKAKLSSACRRMCVPQNQLVPIHFSIDSGHQGTVPECAGKSAAFQHANLHRTQLLLGSTRGMRLVWGNENRTCLEDPA